MLLDTSVFVLDRYDPQSLVRAERDQQEMQDELPRKPVEPDVLLEWTERDLFDEVHLDEALLVFLHYDR